MDSLSFATVCEAHRAAYANQVPAEGNIPLHSPVPVMKRNIFREREKLVQQHPVSVRRDGSAYIYTMPNGELFISYYPPETIQWQPGP